MVGVGGRCRWWLVGGLLVADSWESGWSGDGGTKKARHCFGGRGQTLVFVTCDGLVTSDSPPRKFEGLLQASSIHASDLP